jgi:hypothetical protein
MKSRKHQGRPRSQRDPSLPYTYEAWVDILEGRGSEPVYDHFFADTLCGLIDYLAEQEIEPAHVRLAGHFGGDQVKLDIALCTDDEGTWRRRPELCRILEDHYDHTHEECYRGHVEEGHCAFEDRDRAGAGPLW